MKLTKVTLAAAAIASAALTGNSVHAQAVPGDVILGFETNGGKYTYEVDLGAASQFVGQTAGSTINFSLDASDLSNYVSSTWSTNTAVQFGVVGGTQGTVAGNLTLNGDTFAPNTLFATANAQEGTPKVSTTGGQTNGLTDYVKLSGGYNTPDSGGAYSTDVGNATYYATGTKDTDGFDVLAATSVNFGLPSGAGFADSVVDFNADGSVPSPTSAVLDFYELAPSDASVGTTGATLLGTFGLSDTASNPELTFTAVAAPEPSTDALLGLGGLALLWNLRRKAVQI